MAKSSDIIKIGFDYRASLEQFEKETNGVFDGISEKAGKQRISIQLDAKNDKVIEKIKELQKLKLDKFTFEFGESGLAEQLKTFDQLEKKINEIINLSKGINNIGSGNGIGNSIVDEKSLNSIIDLFGKMESHLGEIKKVFADVGDGGEFSPLLSTIDKINTSIKELSTSVKGIGLNMNIDVGSDSEAEAKVQSKISNALQAYQRLFDHIKMSSAGGSVVNTNFFEFDINQYDTMMAKLQAYKKFIDNMRKEAKSQFNGKDVLFQNTDKSYWSSASAAMGQVTKAFNEMNVSSNTSPLENLFGKTDLTEVVSQLNLIVDKLGEISTTASEFKNVFKDGFNVSASVEEIEKLTSRVKELEDELSKVKVSSVAPVETNISSGNEATNIQDKITDQVVENERRKQKAYKATADVVMYHAGIISKLNKAETNGRFYGSNRGTGYYGTGHYFVDAATKHELDNDRSYANLPYTSIDISQYDNLFKATTNELASGLHNFLENLTRFTQGSDSNTVSELFSQFQKVFGETVMDMQEFDATLEKLKVFMQNSSMEDRSDSVSTQFMKSLGYGGVDTRGTRYADTRYGTVIYDLKEESILQANITDELQKQGQMLEKINYEKGQAFDQKEDTRIQGILDQQVRAKEVNAEFDSLFDSTKINQFESDLQSVNDTLKRNDEIIADCQKGINNADAEARKFARDMEDLGLGGISDEEIAEQANNYRVTFQERIEELERERPLLEARRKELEENLSAEYKLANVAMERARAIVEERHTPIKDTIQGEKIEQATTSARELDRTLEQAVDVPTDDFDKILSKLDLTESKLKGIIKITKQMHIDTDGKPIESYTLKDKYGSTEIYGESSNPQLLRSNIVEYDAKQAEKLQKDFNKAYEEATKINDALTETKGKMDGLSKHPELSSQFSEVETTIKSLNTQLTQGEISVSEYNNAVKETTSSYAKLVDVQQKRDVEVYNADAKQTENQKLEEQKRIYKELNNEIDRYATVSKRIANGKALSSDEEEMAKLQSRIEELQNEPILSKEQLEASQLRLEKIETTLEDIQEITRNTSIDSMQSEIDAYNKRYDNLNIKPSDKNRSAEYQKAIDEYKASIKELETFLANLRASSAPITEEIEQQWSDIVVKVDKASDSVKAFSAAEKGSSADSRMKEIDKLTKYLDANTRISKEAKQQLQGYLALLKSGDPSVNVQKIHTAWTEVAVAEREAGREGKRFWDIISDKALYGQAAQLAGYYLSLTDFIRYGKQAVDTIIELDTALIDLKKTTAMNTSQMEDFYFEANDVAKEMGVTTTAIIEQASAWSRLNKIGLLYGDI